jgi:glycosidase
MSLFNGKNGALAASVVNIFSGGVPLLYTGQEVGKTGTTPFFSNSNINWTANPDMLATYQALNAFYLANDCARKGSLSAYQISSDLVCWKKTYGSKDLLILVNVRNTTINFNLPPILTGSFENALSLQTENISSAMSLGAYGYKILKMN